MTDTSLVGMDWSGIALAVTALTGLLGVIFTAWNTRNVPAIAKDTAVVLGHVNSKETKFTADIEALHNELRIKDQLLAAAEHRASLLAQAAAGHMVTPPPSQGDQ
jgi:hypothetical protein